MRAIAQPRDRATRSRLDQIRRAGGRVGGATELVCVVDDDQSVRRGLRRLFKSAEYAAETFASAEDYLAREIFEGPICLVLDVRMPGLNGLELQKELESRGACEQIVFITGHNDVPTCTEAMKNGAVDFLMKPFDSEELIEAVKRALERGKEHLRKRGQRRDARALIDKLTPREFEVLRFVIIGLLNKQIAAEMDTAEKTIKVHRGRVMHKLGATSVPDLVRISQRAGISPARRPA
ncbi:MAG: DNA-binding response regulator [Verrucomicrobia bacterium]|nr:MAG: DNA-binding response regulator [Verrucomicrobiota bacterium]